MKVIPDLSVVIVSWNTRALLARCLQAVNANLRGLRFEAIVVDNGSTDGSPALVRNEFPDVTLIENQENLGFAKANNQAILLCTSRYILLLNSDAFLTPNAIQTMVQIMDVEPVISIAGAHLRYPDGREQVSHGPLPGYWTEMESLFGLDKLRKRKTGNICYQETGTVSGACMLIRKDLLDQIGLLDESFFFFSEEVDLCSRCHSAGYQVVHVPGACVIHVHGGSTGQTVQRILRLYSSKLLYFNKHFGPKGEQRLRFLIRVATFCKGVAYSLVRILSLGIIKKDKFWFDVSKGMTSSL